MWQKLCARGVGRHCIRLRSLYPFTSIIYYWSYLFLVVNIVAMIWTATSESQSLYEYIYIRIYVYTYGTFRPLLRYQIMVYIAFSHSRLVFPTKTHCSLRDKVTIFSYMYRKCMYIAWASRNILNGIRGLLLRRWSGEYMQFIHKMCLIFLCPIKLPWIQEWMSLIDELTVIISKA